MAYLYLNIDNGLTNSIPFIDLKRTFTTVDTNMLLSNLELYTPYSKMAANKLFFCLHVN